MIQPLQSAQRNQWHVYWLDIDEPVPSGADYMLPTLMLVTDQRGVPVAPPELLEELDQFRVEQFLGALIDRMGAPEKILVGESPDWDAQAWRDFGEDYRVPIEMTKFAGRDSIEMQTISQHVVQQFSSTAETGRDLAQGLVNTALRMRSEAKKIALLKKALASDTDCADARIELADADFRRSDWKAALSSYDGLIAKERSRWASRRPDWWSMQATRPYLRAIYGRAMTLWHQGRFPGAAETLQDLLEINPRDHQGVRFLVPLVHLLADDFESADASFDAYVKNYAGDYSEPSFLFGWGLLHSYFGRDGDAVKRYQDGILKNFYIPPMLLDLPSPSEQLWHSSDRSDVGYARDFMDSYGTLWDRLPAARRNLREAWDAIFPRVQELVELRQKMLDFQDQRYEPNYKKLWQELVAADERLTTPPGPES